MEGVTLDLWSYVIIGTLTHFQVGAPDEVHSGPYLSQWSWHVRNPIAFVVLEWMESQGVGPPQVGPYCTHEFSSMV